MADVLAPNPANYIKGGATILFQRNGLSGFADLGNIADFSIAPSTNYIEHKTARSGRLVTDRRERTEEGFIIKIGQDEFNAQNLALVLNAPDPSTFTQSGTTHNITISNPVLGVKYDVGYVRCTGITVTVAASTKAEGTDFTFEKDIGFIRFLASGTILDTDDVDVSVMSGGVTGMTVAPLASDGLLQGAVTVAVRAEDGRLWIYKHTKATLAYSGDIAMSGTTFSKAQGTLTIEADPSSATPYGQWQLLPAA